MEGNGPPTVRKQRDRWVVRVDGIDTAAGKKDDIAGAGVPGTRTRLTATIGEFRTAGAVGSSPIVPTTVRTAGRAKLIG